MTSSRPQAALLGAAFGAGALFGRVSASSQIRFARMAGSSIAGPRRRRLGHRLPQRRLLPARAGRERDVDDLRLAFAILTTHWHALGRPAAARRRRRRRSTARSARDRFVDGRAPRAGRSTASSCSRAPARLLGDWFADAYADDDAARLGHRVRDRRRSAPPTTPSSGSRWPRLGAATRPRPRRPSEQIWHTYPPVEMPSADGRHRRAHAARDVAGLRQRARALHAAAPRRAGGPDVRDRGRRRHRARAARSSPAAT